MSNRNAQDFYPGFLDDVPGNLAPYRIPPIYAGVGPGAFHGFGSGEVVRGWPGE